MSRIFSEPRRRLVVCCVLAILVAARAAAQTVGGSVLLTAADGTPLKKADASGVVVWLQPVGGPPRPAAAPLKPAVMSQRNKTFLPHLLAVEVGTAVDFPNDDPIFHNVFSNYDGQVFDVQVYAPKLSRRVVFRRAGIVHVFCNIHETMSAVIAVLPTPYFAVTGPDGRFQIKAPAGEYTFEVWHERAEPDVTARLQRRVTIGAADVTMPASTIALSNQPVVPHKNKYGQSYAFTPAGNIFYPGTRR